MLSALQRALRIITSCDPELMNILAVTARMSFCSSLAALLIGTPTGILLGAKRFPGRQALILINRTLMGMPPVVCGLLFYLLFSGVGPFGGARLLFTVKLMILAQIVLITPLVVNSLESYVSGLAAQALESAAGMGLGGGKKLLLLANECVYQIFAAYFLAFSRAIAEVGAVSMVGGAIAWKTNIMTTAIMQYTNRGDFSMGIALGIILMALSLLVNLLLTLAQRRLSR